MADKGGVVGIYMLPKIDVQLSGTYQDTPGPVLAANFVATNAYLATLPSRAAFRARMTQMYDYERFGIPEKAGNFYFYDRNDGLQNQAVLYVREGLNGTPRLLIDPNTWSADAATALAEWDPSEDGRHLLYSVQEGGTDSGLGEIRGGKLVGGKLQILHPGDRLVIPPGMPHIFTATPGHTFTYLIFKQKT